MRRPRLAPRPRRRAPRPRRPARAPGRGVLLFRRRRRRRGRPRGDAHGLAGRSACLPRTRRDPERFGATQGESGVVYTRTGRAFLSPTLTEQLLARVHAAVASAGLWDELATDWLLLDAELLPWSLKAEGLLREQYAAVGAAARLMLPAVASSPAAASDRGLDVAALAGRVRERDADVAAFGAAHRRYCWEVDGLSGVSLASFLLLAGEGSTWHDRSHLWHLDRVDRMQAADPTTLRLTRRLVVDVTDETSRAAGTAWWEDLTSSGGGGMVVKPLANLTRTPKGLVQPGLMLPAAASTCASSTAPTTRGRSTSAVSRTATSVTSARSRAGSMSSAWSRSSGSRAASRCGASTSRSSPCSRWSPSRWTRGSRESRVAVLLSGPGWSRGGPR